MHHEGGVYHVDLVCELVVVLCATVWPMESEPIDLPLHDRSCHQQPWRVCRQTRARLRGVLSGRSLFEFKLYRPSGWTTALIGQVEVDPPPGAGIIFGSFPIILPEPAAEVL